MNACGQHNMANIGFQGMTVRTPDKLVAPAITGVIGGGNLEMRMEHLQIKLLKCQVDVVLKLWRRIFDDYEANANENYL